MDYPSARELELTQRVARLEAEMAQVRAFVNMFRASMGQAPLQPPVPDVVAVPSRTPTTTRPSHVPARKSPGIQLIWLERRNATKDQVQSFKVYLDLPDNRYAINAESASVIVAFAFSPGNRADVSDFTMHAPPFAGKSVYLVILAAGQAPVNVYGSVIPQDQQFSFPLDDNFVEIRNPTGEDARRNLSKLRTLLKQNLAINSSILSSLPTIESVGASIPRTCAMCKEIAVYQSPEGVDFRYCTEHVRQWRAT